MNVLHLASEYPPQRVYGLGKFVRDLAEEQVRLGCKVYVISNSLKGEYDKVVQNGVTVYRVEYPLPPKPYYSQSQLIMFNILILRRIADLGIDFIKAIDAIASHDWLTSLAGVCIGKAFSISHICTFHDTILGKKLGKIETAVDDFSHKAEQFAANMSNTIIANSEPTAEELICQFNISKEKIHVIPCAITPSHFELAPNPDRLDAFRKAFAEEEDVVYLYVGRLDPEKGVSNLLKAFFEARLPKAKLLIAGTGTLSDQLRKLAASYDSQQQVRFLGYVETPVLSYLYHIADVQVCPSLYEPFGIVALEGMVHGTAVIASDTGGLAATIHDNKSGLLVRPNDVVELKQAIIKVYKNSKLRQNLSEEGRLQVYRSHTWLISAKRTIEVYKQCVPSENTERKRYENILLGTDLYSKGGYSSGRRNRRLRREFLNFAGNIETISTDKDDLVLVETFFREDSGLLNALNLSGKLLPMISSPPKTIYTLDWEAALAASIFKNHQNRPHIIRIPIPITGYKETAATSESSRFLNAIRQWAFEFAPDAVPDAASNVSGQAFNRCFESFDLQTWGSELRSTFRSSLADPNEIVFVIAQRLSPPFKVNWLFDLVKACGELRLATRWIVCGDGCYRTHIENVAKEDGLPITCIGYQGEAILGALYTVCDVVCVLIEPGEHSDCLFEAFAAEKIIILANGVSLPKSRPEYRVKFIDFTSFAAIRQGLESALVQGISRRQHNSLSELEGFPREKPEGLLLFNNWGIGDELLMTAVAREIKRTYPTIRIWVQSRHGFEMPNCVERSQPPVSVRQVECIYQNPVLYGPSYHSPFPGSLVQQMLDKVFIDTGLKVTAKSIVPELNLRKPEKARCGKTIAMHCRPNIRFPSKDWGLSNWAKLCDLLISNGYDVIQLGAADDPQLPGAKSMTHLKPFEIPEIVAGVSVVVCLVGFLMHVAAATGTPAIVIYGGREHPAIDGYTNHIHVSSAPLACRGRWGCNLAPDAICKFGMECMREILPDDIFSILSSQLGDPT